jgi:predicted DNA-binding transcriptional regulator YafY
MGHRSFASAAPHRISFSNGTFYLISYCHHKHEVRIFGLDRIKMVDQTKDGFEVHGLGGSQILENRATQEDCRRTIES